MNPNQRKWCDDHWEYVFFVPLALVFGAVGGFVLVVAMRWV